MNTRSSKRLRILRNRTIDLGVYESLSTAQEESNIGDGGGTNENGNEGSLNDTFSIRTTFNWDDYCTIRTEEVNDIINRTRNVDCRLTQDGNGNEIDDLNEDDSDIEE